MYPEGRAGPHADCGGDRDPQGEAHSVRGSPSPLSFLPGMAPRPWPILTLLATEGRGRHAGPGREQDTMKAAQRSPADLRSVSTAPQAARGCGDGLARRAGHEGSGHQAPGPGLAPQWLSVSMATDRCSLNFHFAEDA